MSRSFYLRDSHVYVIGWPRKKQHPLLKLKTADRLFTIYYPKFSLEAYFAFSELTVGDLLTDLASCGIKSLKHCTKVESKHSYALLDMPISQLYAKHYEASTTSLSGDV